MKSPPLTFAAPMTAQGRISMTSTMTWPARLRQQWFWPVAAMLVALDILVVKRLSVGVEPWHIEAGLLADWCLVAPLLYVCCFRRDGRRAILRAVALACGGFYLAGHLLPAREGGLIDVLEPVRYLCLGVLLCLEVYVMLSVYRMIFRGGSVDGATEHLQQQLGMPAWAARLIAIEATFWRRTAAAIQRWLRRR